MILLFLLTILILYIINFYRNVKSYPPGPLPLPIIGNMFRCHPKKLHLWMGKQIEKYGPVFTLWLPRPIVFIGDYETIKEALVTKGDDFSGRNTDFPDSLFHEAPDVGVLFTEGESWRNQRRLAIHFLRNQGMGKNAMEEKILMVINDCITHIDSLKDKENVDMSKLVYLTVGNVITLLLFGYTHSFDNSKKFSYYMEVLDKLVKEASKWEFVILSLIPTIEKVPIISDILMKRFVKNTRDIEKINIEEIKECKKSYDPNNEPQNFVHAFLKEVSSEDSPYSYLTEKNLEGMVVDFWIAGMETTTTTLKWLLLLLMKYPEVQEKIQQEIDKVVGIDEEIRMKHKNEMPYLTAVIYEGQRFANILAFVPLHKCTKDNYIGGNFIKKDTLVQPFFYTSNMEEKYYKDPHTFNPERYLESDGKTLNKQLIDLSLIFGAGKRQCAGESLAKMEIFLVLGTLLQKYKFSHDHAPVDLSTIFGGVLVPKEVHCKIEKRCQ